MKLDAETLRKLALSGARNRLRELEKEVEELRNVVRQLSGASVPGPKAAPKEKRRKRRSYTEKFKAAVVREAREADNASAVGKKHNITPSLVRTWMEKAK